MLKISNTLFIPLAEIEFNAIRSQGSGGQHVNKVSTAIHLRFNIAASSLPEDYKTRLLKLNDYRISKEGIIIIKAQNYRSQEKNKAEAIQRLVELVKKVSVTPRKRRKTKPSKTSVRKRLDSKTLRGAIKKLRQTPD